MLKTEYVNRFTHGLNDVTGHIAEGRCKHVLSSLPNLVPAAEGAMCDCGVVFDDCMKTLPLNDRLNAALRMVSGAEPSTYATDIKCIWAIPDKRKARTTFFYAINATKTEMSICQQFIITSYMTPHLVAMIPTQMLKKMHVLAKGREDGSVILCSRAMSLTDARPEPFPMECSPYIFHFRDLPNHLQDAITTYRNERMYGGQKSSSIGPSLYRSSLQATDVLKPTEASMLQDLETILTVQDAMRSSDHFFVELLLVAPSIGDFAITHKESKSAVTIEVKSSLAKVVEHKGFVRHLNRLRGPFEGIIFTPFSQWDYLLTLISDRKALLIPRGNIPVDCFETYADSVEIPLCADWQERWLFDLSDASDLEHQLSNLLRIRLEHGAFRPLPTPTFTKIVPSMHDSLLADDVLPDHAESDPDSEADEKSRRRWSARRFEADQHVWLSQMCARSSWGAIYALGRKHPSATHVLVPDLVEVAKPFFHELPEHMPAILLNFLQFDRLDSREVSDMRRPWQSVRASHGTTRSFYVFVNQEKALQAIQLNRYVVPSEALNCPERHAMSEQVIKSGHTSNLYIPYTRALPLASPRMPMLLRVMLSWPSSKSYVPLH